MGRWRGEHKLYDLWRWTTANTFSAWTAIGLATRFAISLNYHTAIDSALDSDEQARYRHRVWLSLCYIETHICAVRGLPSAIEAQAFEHSVKSENDTDQKRHTSMPARRASLQSPKNLDTTMHSTYLERISKLSAIKQTINGYIQQPSNQISNNGFSAANFRSGANDFDTRLNTWARSLSSQSFLRDGQPEQPHRNERRQLALLLAFYSAKMTLCRPFLAVQKAELVSKPASRHNWTSGCYYAETCLSVAGSIIKLVDRLPTAASFFETPCMWNSIQVLCQAGETILYEHRSDLGNKMSNDKFELVHILVKWLRIAEKVSNMAYELRQACCEEFHLNS